MSKFTLLNGTEDEFFLRGRQLAKAADGGEPIPNERIVSFEDPMELMKLITGARLALLRTVKKTPGSITDIALRLQRDRSAVKRDLDALERAGLVTIAEKTFPGHGRRRKCAQRLRASSSRRKLPRGERCGGVHRHPGWTHRLSLPPSLHLVT